MTYTSGVQIRVPVIFCIVLVPLLVNFTAVFHDANFVSKMIVKSYL